MGGCSGKFVARSLRPGAARARVRQQRSDHWTRGLSSTLAASGAASRRACGPLGAARWARPVGRGPLGAASSDGCRANHFQEGGRSARRATAAIEDGSVPYHLQMGGGHGSTMEMQTTSRQAGVQGSSSLQAHIPCGLKVSNLCVGCSKASFSSTHGRFPYLQPDRADWKLLGVPLGRKTFTKYHPFTAQGLVLIKEASG